MHRSPNNKAYQLQRAEALNQLSHAYWAAGRHNEAQNCFSTPAEISKQLSSEAYDWHESFYTSARFRGYGGYEVLRLKAEILQNQAILRRP